MPNKEADTSKSKLPLYISIGILVALVIAYFVVPSVQDFLNKAWSVLTSDNEERIQQWVSGFGWFGPVVLVLAMVAQLFLLVVPSILLMIVSVLAASTVGYFIGSYFGDAFVKKIIGKKSEKKVASFLDDYGFWAI